MSDARRLTLGLDVGTQSTKALVLDADSMEVVARASCAYGLIPDLAPGAAEQHPATWTEAVEKVMDEVLADSDAGAVRAMSVSGQQHGLVALDASDQVIRPAKLWCDTETSAEAAELGMPAGYTAPKVMWMQRHEPAAFDRLRTILLPHDYVNLHLTGARVSECGDASGTGFFDPVERVYKPSFFDAALLPELIPHDRFIGTLRPALAERLGLGPIPVAPGSGDNMLSALGSGAVTEGTVVMSLGTSGTLFAHADAPVIDPAGAVAPFCDATGGWLPLVCTMNCTTPLEEVSAAHGVSLAQLTDLAAKEAPGSSGLTFLPYLAGERTPDWPGASGVLHGIRPGTLRPGLVFRAAMEGASFALQQGWQRMQALGLKADEIRLVGGGSANPLWRCILADLFGVPLCLPAEAETAALGAAIQAAAILEETSVADFLSAHPLPMEGEAVTPDAGRSAVYRDAAAEFERLGARLFP